MITSQKAKSNEIQIRSFSDSFFFMGEHDRVSLPSFSAISSGLPPLDSRYMVDRETLWEEPSVDSMPTSPPPKKRRRSSNMGRKFIQYKKNGKSPDSAYQDNKSIDGPPVTSRFYRFARSEPSKAKFYQFAGIDATQAKQVTTAAAGGTGHHYQPFIHPQNRSRVVASLDYMRSNAKDEMGVPTQAPSIPELRPSAEEFADPIKYIESIRSLGQRYGAIKIIPPPNALPEWYLNTETLWLQTRRQLWGSEVNELNSRVKFHNKLAQAAKDNHISIGKIPSIDRRHLDMYRFYRCVQLRGGFDKCCEEKMWAQIGRELGFYGKVTSSLSSSVKAAYQRYLSAIPPETPTGFTTKRYIENPSVLPVISGSSLLYKRPKTALIQAGFDTYYDQITLQKKGLTISDDTTLPAYDFDTWHHTNIDDSSPYVSRTSSMYGLRQFHEKSCSLRKWTEDRIQHPINDPRVLEDTFWKLFGDPQTLFETEAAFDISVDKQGSDPVITSSENLLDPWNLHNLPLCSILQYLDIDVKPTMNFGMFFSAQSWAVQDHWLYNADIQRMGDCKVWYFIPEKDRVKFEKLLREFIQKKNDEATETPQYYRQFCELVKDSSIDASVALENRLAADVKASRELPKEESFAKFMDTDRPFRFNDEVLLSPSYLQSHGIDVYSAYQKPGDIIIKFPAAYNSSISLGTTVNESVPFALPNWLSNCDLAVNWMQQQQILPGFSTFRYLINMAKMCVDRDELKSLAPVLDRWIDNELQLREKAHQKGKKSLRDSSRPESEFTVTDADLVDTFPSHIVLTDREDKSKTFTMSLQWYIDKFDPTTDGKKFKTSMVTYLTDETLKTIGRSVRVRQRTGTDWVKRYDECIAGYDKPPMKLLKPLVNEGELTFGPTGSEHSGLAFDLFTSLKTEIARTESWVERANKFLQYKVTSRMRQRNGEESIEYWNSVEELDTLLEEISRLSVSSPEMDQLLELSEEINSFNNQVVSVLSGENNSSSIVEINNLYLVGQCFGVKLDAFFLLERILKRRKWLEKAERKLHKPMSKDSVESLLTDGERVCTKEDAPILDQLRELQQKTAHVEADVKRFIDSIDGQVMVQELEDCAKEADGVPISSLLREMLTNLRKEHEAVVNWMKVISDEGATIEKEVLLENLSQACGYRELVPSVGQLRVAIVEPLEKAEAEMAQLVDPTQLAELIKQDRKMYNLSSDSKSYCICRLHHEDDAMIECDGCQEWFHFKCIGLEENAQISSYLCPICDSNCRMDTTVVHERKMARKPSLASVERAVADIKRLKVTTPELNLMERWMTQAEKFRTRFKDALTESDGQKLKFFLRLMDGGSISFAERTQFKQQLSLLTQRPAEESQAHVI